MEISPLASTADIDRKYCLLFAKLDHNGLLELRKNFKGRARYAVTGWLAT